MVIKLFDKEGKKYIYNVTKPIGHGSYSMVYKLSDDICLKYTPSYRMYDYCVLKKLMELDLDNYYKIYKLLFDYNDDFSGYLMQYYEKEDINILLEPIDYTLDNFYRIYNSVNKITENGIIINDMHDGNVVMNKNDIIIIDADFYDEGFEVNSQKLRKDNNDALLELFMELYKNSLNFINPSLEEYRVIFDLFSKSEDVSMIYNKLAGYTYPIDYIKSKTLKKQY